MLKTETILDAGEPLRPLLKTAGDWRLMAEYARAIEALVRAECAPQWRDIETAPKETELLVGRMVNDDWRICQSGFYFDAGNDMAGESAYWYWHCDWDNGGVTDGEGPTHWMPLPAAPGITAPQAKDTNK